MKLTDDLYAFPWEGYENNCNSFYFGGAVRCLIDVGHARFVDDLLASLAGDGITQADIRLVIATHSHPDHIEGIGRLAGADTPVAMHPEAAKYLRGMGRVLYAFLASRVPSFEVGVELAEGPAEALDGLVEVYHTPGHEPGAVCIYWPEKRALATGDLLFREGVGRTDFPGGSHRELMRQIDRVAELDVEYLLPGHGPVIVGRDEVARNYEAVRRMFG
jgi:hydroxyacylglutathione hydrolase